MPASNPAAAATDAVLKRLPLLPNQEEPCARLQFAIENSHRLALVFGPSGTGKSWLLAHLAEDCKRTGVLSARVSLAGLSETEVLWEILAAWGLNPPPDVNPARLWRTFGDQLAALAWQDRRAVLFLDDVERGPTATLASLQRLFSLESAARTLTVIAAAESFSRSKLPKNWLELAELRADLEPFAAEESATFLKRTDGPTKSMPHFTPEAVTTLHKLAEGLPRRLDQLQQLVLIATEASGDSAVDAATIEQVYRELFVAPRGS